MLDVTPVEATTAHTLLSVLAIQLGRCPRYNHRVMSPFVISALDPLPFMVYIAPKLRKMLMYQTPVGADLSRF